MTKKAVAITLTAIIGATLLVGCTGKSNTNVENNQNVEVDKQDKQTNKDKGYVHSEYIVDTSWLSNHLDDENLVVLDARDEKSYNKGHIPGAINVQWQTFCDMSQSANENENWATLLPIDDLSNQISNLGINQDSKIVVYVDNEDGWGEDGRITWMMNMIGLDSSMLDGGFEYWKENNNQVSKDTASPQKTDFKIEKLNDETLATTDYVVKNLDTAKIIDTRDDSEYEGAQKYGEKRGGHIPGAINIEFNEVFNDDESIKSQAEIEELFSSYGINKNDNIITYCTTGIRSAHMQQILKMAGYENVKNYDASYIIWASNDNLEVIK